MAKKQIADKNKLYAIRRPQDKTASEIVMNVETDRAGFAGICYLTPPDRGHMIEGKVEGLTWDGFAFIADQGGGKDRRERWEFIEVTYDNFKKEFYKIVYGGEKLLEQVHNTQELQDYYHANFPDYA